MKGWFIVEFGCIPKVYFRALEYAWSTNAHYRILRCTLLQTYLIKYQLHVRYATMILDTMNHTVYKYNGKLKNIEVVLEQNIHC